ncbi:MAG: AarF/ABC1/UbiB kinase family protein [Deltaproteobacteria bacterium]|nr:AarF/ABC1/UbiB kinase family protein [Deltaproteobacteria bacterium]
MLDALMAALNAREGTPVPTSPLGRLRRSAGAALRFGTARLLHRGALDPDTVAKLVLSLGELKGTAMKLGQILSYVGTDLPSPVRRQLALLQRSSQPTTFAEIEATLREDLGPRAEELLRGLERTPVATASIGQVHRARLPDGTPVAVKVRHPGIVQAIRADFRSAQVGKVLGEALVPGANVKEIISEAEERFLEECDYGAELRRQEQFRKLYAGHDTLVVPRGYAEWSGPRVLTSEWLDGRRLEDVAAHAPQAERDRYGHALYEFYIGSLYRHRLFNADPHPGNLLFGAGTLAALDYGCVREFDEPTVRLLADLSLAVREDDTTSMRRTLVALGTKEPDAGPGLDVTRRMLRGFFAPALTRGVHRIAPDAAFDLRQMAIDKRNLGRLRLPGKLLFLFRIRFGLHAVLATLGAEADWREVEARLAAVSRREL